MKCIWVVIFCMMLGACSEDTSSVLTDQGRVRLSMAIQGIYDFPTYIRTLTVYAFRQNEKGEYVFHAVLADLDEQEIRALRQGKSPGENYTESRLLNKELPVGNYRLYFVANTRAGTEAPLQTGITRPSQVYLLYPEEGLVWSFFLGEAAVIAGETVQTVPVELHRVVSRIFLKLMGVPEQIDKIRMSVGNVAGKLTLEGERIQPIRTEEIVFTMKNEDLYIQDTVLFEIYTFPTIGEESELKLVFLSRSGEERIKNIPIQLLPDRYLYLTAEINSGCDALLSFDFTCVLFFVWDWRDIELPEFPLKPRKDEN